MGAATALATATARMGAATALATATARVGAATALATATARMGAATALATATARVGAATAPATTSAPLLGEAEVGDRDERKAQYGYPKDPQHARSPFLGETAEILGPAPVATGTNCCASNWHWPIHQFAILPAGQWGAFSLVSPDVFGFPSSPFRYKMFLS
jgi:hypothetical protein